MQKVTQTEKLDCRKDGEEKADFGANSNGQLARMVDQAIHADLEHAVIGVER